jgi:hypothetical protein
MLRGVLLLQALLLLLLLQHAIMISRLMFHESSAVAVCVLCICQLQQCLEAANHDSRIERECKPACTPWLDCQHRCFL